MAEADDKALVAQILSSYLSNNIVAPADLSFVIETVKKAFGRVDPFPAAATGETTERRQPAVPVKTSVASDAITCLCCGDKFKSLKRHIQAEHKLTPDEYRAVFDLKKDYPIVAPDYAAQRSALSKSLGLGRKLGAKARAPSKKAVNGRAPKKIAAHP